MATGYEHLSEEELLESLSVFPRDADGFAQPELLGEYSLEEAEELGAFFEDPAEQEAFDRALAQRKRQLAAQAASGA